MAKVTWKCSGLSAWFECDKLSQSKKIFKWCDYYLLNWLFLIWSQIWHCQLIMHLHALTKPLNLQVSSIIHFNLNAERRFEGKLSSLVLHTCVLHLASTPVHKALAVYVALGRFRLRWLFSVFFPVAVADETVEWMWRPLKRWQAEGQCRWWRSEANWPSDVAIL